jgi:hypothetical protein
MCLKCLTTEEPLVAQRNIFCWKSLNRNRRSQHQDYYTYKLDALQKETKLESVISYSYEGKIVNQGFHSWKKRIIKGRRANYLFMIPKGVEYYEGIQHDNGLGYASANIICLGHWLLPMTWIRAFKYQSENDKK